MTATSMSGALHVSPTRGMTVEQEPIAILPYACVAADLGKAGWDALLRFKHVESPTPRKLTEWPAFRESGAKSVREFERAFTCVRIEALPGTLRVEGLVPVPAADGLFVGRYVTNVCDAHQLGELVLVVTRCVLHVAEAEYP